MKPEDPLHPASLPPASWLAPLESDTALQGQPGGRRLLAFLREHLATGDDPAQAKTWTTWLEALSRGRSPETRRRYTRLLRRAAQAWHRAGLLDGHPEADLPATAPRRRLSTVPLERLTYPFSAYRRLAAHLADALTGRLPGPVVPPWLEQADPAALTALGLLLGGLAVSRPGRYLAHLQADDLHLTAQGAFLFLRHRDHEGWFPLAPLPALLLALLRERRSSAPLFPQGLPRRAVQRLLDAWTAERDLPQVTPSQLTPLARLDLQQILPQPVLAALLGRIPTRSVPAGQLKALLQADFLLPAEDEPWPVSAGTAPEREPVASAPQGVCKVARETSS